MAFQCVLMDDPVVAADGHTYNREDIENWFKEHSTSPHTNEQLEHKMLIPNIAIRRQINAWCEQHGLPALSFAQPVKAQAQGGGGGGAAGGGAQIVKPAAVCGFSKKALQGFCLPCKKGICINCQAIQKLDEIAGHPRSAKAMIGANVGIPAPASKIRSGLSGNNRSAVANTASLRSV